jgi:hypothetical protein
VELIPLDVRDCDLGVMCAVNVGVLAVFGFLAFLLV